jgi:hypothetical protein
MTEHKDETFTKTIGERTVFLNEAKFDFEDRQEIERVLEWLTDFPDDAAQYIVWLEGFLLGIPSIRPDHSKELIGRIMHILDDIARFTPEVFDALDNEGKPYQSAGLSDLLTRARSWVVAEDWRCLGHVTVPAEPTEAMLAAGLAALINEGLDGPDGVGHSEALACFKAMCEAAA